MKTFKFSLVLRTREKTDVFISFDDNICDIHSKKINILYLFTLAHNRISHEYSCLFIIVINLSFVFALMLWLSWEPLFEPIFMYFCIMSSIGIQAEVG